jgi:hypothetical protein
VERFHGRFPHHSPSAEIDAYEVKLTGKWTWRPECVVLVVEDSGGMSEGAVAGVAVAAALEVVCCSRPR